ncbi:T9SS type A sorting domain-containing protein [Flavobacterium sp. RSB2_4_14]|uniref:T9SS type A sorting domain-containing protein n=1 Tax=Flavobacterium sp. RSB2_4_14 TaxID=3447665 RepID=UPI003F40EBB7
MKKLLLLSLFVAPLFSSAQVLLSEDFNALTVGDVSTEITGTIPGQGDYLFFASNGTAPTTSTNAGVTNSQIVSGGNASLGLQFEGPNGDKGSRYMWQDGFPALWAARVSGNNIVELELDINPGAGTTTSRNTFGAYIFNAAGDRVLAGFTVRAATRELFLVAYSTPTGNPVGSYTYSLAAAPGIQLPADTFSRIGISYNKTTGQVLIKGPGIAAAGISVNGSATGTDPAEVDFISFSGNTTAAPNSSSATMVMDNLQVKAVSTGSLLSVNQVTNNVDFSVYPNPSRDLVTISNDMNAVIETIEMTDLNGRVVKSQKINATDAQVSISDLSTGVYMMKIVTDQGTATKKVVKE